MKLFGYTIIPTKQLDKTLSECASVKKTLRQVIDDWLEVWQRTDPDFYSIELDEQGSRWKVLMCRGLSYLRKYILIKSFPFKPNNDDDKDYAERCAEELVDKLREKI